MGDENMGNKKKYTLRESMVNLIYGVEILLWVLTAVSIITIAYDRMIWIMFGFVWACTIGVSIISYKVRKKYKSTEKVGK